MFSMSDSSVESWSTGKSYKFPFKDTSLYWKLLTPSDIFPKDNPVGKLTFLI